VHQLVQHLETLKFHWTRLPNEPPKREKPELQTQTTGCDLNHPANVPSGSSFGDKTILQSSVIDYQTNSPQSVDLQCSPEHLGYLQMHSEGPRLPRASKIQLNSQSDIEDSSIQPSEPIIVIVEPGKPLRFHSQHGQKLNLMFLMLSGQLIRLRAEAMQPQLHCDIPQRSAGFKINSDEAHRQQRTTQEMGVAGLKPRQCDAKVGTDELPKVKKVAI